MLDALNPGAVQKAYFQGEEYFHFKNLGKQIMTTYAQTQHLFNMAGSVGIEDYAKGAEYQKQIKLKQLDEKLGEIKQIVKSQDAEAEKLLNAKIITQKQFDDYLKASNGYLQSFNSYERIRAEFGLSPYHSHPEIFEVLDKHFERKTEQEQSKTQQQSQQEQTPTPKVQEQQAPTKQKTQTDQKSNTKAKSATIEF